MFWNWQRADWPNFAYDETALIALETQFIYRSGVVFGVFKHLDNVDKQQLTVEVISEEALKTSAIEGEYLSRDSLQSSIRRQFGLATDQRRIQPAEQGIAELMVNLYRTSPAPLSDAQLFAWHTMVMSGQRSVKEIGHYRTHLEPMQVVSGPIHEPRVHFEAPPSTQVPTEMAHFIAWFNRTAPGGDEPPPALTRAGIAHLYFVSIHPFEDGNGRIGRAIAEKALAQSLGRPTLVALSYMIEKHKKAYYDALEQANKFNEITGWLTYFAQTIVAAQQHTQQQIEFLIEKGKLYDRVRGQLNGRQEKVLARLFREGPEGFSGGLSAGNYQRIAKTSKATATRDLQELVDKQALIKIGERKSTRYYLNLSSGDSLEKQKL